MVECDRFYFEILIREVHERSIEVLAEGEDIKRRELQSLKAADVDSRRVCGSQSASYTTGRQDRDRCDSQFRSHAPLAKPGAPPTAGFEVQLDPSFEPESDHPDAQNTQEFAVLQKHNRVNLVVPVDAPHMYHAAMGSKSCKLTVLGEHYRRLVERGRL